MSEVLLQLENIKKSFDEVDVLEGISLSIKRGSLLHCLAPPAAERRLRCAS